MKLLFVIPEYLPDSGGGIITFYRFLLPELVRQGHIVHAVVSDGRHIGDPDKNIDGVTIRFIDSASHGRWLSQFARYRMTMPWVGEQLALAWAAWEKASYGENYDHVETTDWPLLFVPWIVNRHRVPCTVQLHGSHGQITWQEPGGENDLENGFVRLLETCLLKEAAFLQSNSYFNALGWEALLGRTVAMEYPPFGLSPAKTVNHSNGQKATQAVVFARLHHGKGALRLAETISAYLKQDIRIDWFGEDTAYGTSGTSTSRILQSRFPQIIGSQLQHHGPISHDEVIERMTKAQFVLIPSMFDAFNLTCAESMAVGSIAVCSTLAGAHELIQHGVNGFRYNPLNAEELLNVIEKIRALSGKQAKDIKECAQAVQKVLDPEKNVARRAERYRRIAGTDAKPQLHDWYCEAVSPSANESMGRVILENCGIKDLTFALAGKIQERIGLQINSRS